MPIMTFSFKLIDVTYFKELFKKGVAFQAFPLGNALSIQGNILIIQLLIGPLAVALFGTAKTLVNVVKQVIDIINQASWPELSHLMGSQDYDRAKYIHRIGVLLSLIISIGGVLFLLFFGKSIYSLWTGNSINLPYHILILLLLPVPLNALWFTSSVVHMASNRHEGLAIRYLIAAACSTISSIGLTYFFGLEGTAISLLVMEILLIPYVIKYSIKLTGDDWNSFLVGLLNILKNIRHIIRNRSFLAIIKKT